MHTYAPTYIPSQHTCIHTITTYIRVHTYTIKPSRTHTHIYIHTHMHAYIHTQGHVRIKDAPMAWVWPRMQRGVLTSTTQQDVRERGSAARTGKIQHALLHIDVQTTCAHSSSNHKNARQQQHRKHETTHKRKNTCTCVNTLLHTTALVPEDTQPQHQEGRTQHRCTQLGEVRHGDR